MPANRRVRKADAARRTTQDVLSADDKAFFKSLWDRKKTPIEAFISFFDIKTEESEDDEPAYVRFILRALQAELLKGVLAAWAAGMAALYLILKGRRYGMSIFLIALGLERFVRVPGYEVMLIAQDDVMAEYHFGKLRELFDQIPDGVLDYLGITVLKGTTHEIRLRHKNGRISHFWVAPAKRRALGRGGGVNLLICTEYPSWPAAAKQDLTGVLRSVKKTRGNAVFFESTAMGREAFWRRCKNAREGKSNYTFFFVPSFAHPLAFKNFKNDALRDDFEQRLGMDEMFGTTEELVLLRRLIEDEKWKKDKALRHLHHRRAVIMDDCEGVLSVYHREEPTTPEEAFEGTGRPVFNGAYLNAWEPHAEKKEDASWRGNLRVVIREKKAHVEFDHVTNDRAQLLWTIYEYPQPDASYCWGADVASGYEVYRDGKSVADHSTCKIKEVITGRTVAVLCDYVDPKALAWEILKAAHWYGNAMGFVERNMDGGTTISHLEELEIGDVNGSEIMLGSFRTIKTDEQGQTQQFEFGFKTTVKTKTKLVDEIKTFLASKTQERMPGPDAVCPFDAETLGEMGSFVRLLPAGGAVKKIGGTVPMGADEGWDDRVIDEGLSLLARQEVMLDMKTASRVPPRESAAMTTLRSLYGAGRRMASSLGDQF